MIELERVLGSDELASCLDSALRDGRVSEDLVHRRIAALRSSGRHGLPTLLDVLVGNEATRGGQSWLEREYLKMIAAAGLPRPETQVTLTKAGDRLVRVDCSFPGSRVVVELLGYRFHRTRAQMASDAARMNALLAEGCLPYQFTYDQVTRSPAAVIETTRHALGS
jgi:very-short-patch-repair endonuclease